MTYLAASEIAEGIADLESGFMVPDICQFDSDPETGSYLEPNDPRADNRGSGFYARLSAPGYLDCTEWAGPFETEHEAEIYLVETYCD